MPSTEKSLTLRLVLGDQLNSKHSWFSAVDPAVSYVLMEVRQETDYAAHHIQKVLAFFAAMRRFAHQLQAQGHTVHYIKLDDAANTQTIKGNLEKLISRHGFERFEWLQPDEYRLDRQLKEIAAAFGLPYAMGDTEHFMSTREELAAFFKGKKQFLMESFYRYMRRKHQVLMDGEEPLTGQWNYDADNRSKMPAAHVPPPPLLFANDVSALAAMLTKQGVHTIGSVDAENLLWSIDKEQSLQLLDYFCKHCLCRFGTFQDAMTPQYWSVYHSRLSFAMNVKLLSPREVIDRAIAAWEASKEEIAYHQLEGFVRQIIGWREYMRGIYWMQMPQYATLNYFAYNAKLPSWFWNGNTRMHCLKHSIQQSLGYAYAHHIQRLMVTGNFALLAGIDPDEVDAWYLGIYIDAIEWVEITNTRGMSQFADGGIVGSKPYVSSAAYINKMSSYCSSCYYKHDKKTGERACPFNSLYWNFFDRHRTKLNRNPRIGMMLRTWDKMAPETRAAILEQAAYYLEHMEGL